LASIIGIVKRALKLNMPGEIDDKTCTGVFMKVILLIALFALASCAHVSKTNKLKLGMDRAQFEEIMGEPNITKGSGQYTYLTYELMVRRGFPIQYTDYVFVFSPENKLIQFGTWADFGSSQNLNINVLNR
jgi:hypothetical protein